jgi:hypothetical protein
MQHTGQFHVFARAGLLSGGNTQLQAMWWPGYRSDFASGAGGIPNPWVTVLSTTSGYSWVDLGVVDARPDPAFGGWGLVLRVAACRGRRVSRSTTCSWCRRRRVRPADLAVESGERCDDHV